MKGQKYKGFDILGSKGNYMIFFFGSVVNVVKTIKDAKNFIDEILT